MNKEGINFRFAGHIVNCDQNPTRCTRRLYGPITPDDVEVVVPNNQTYPIVGICPIVSSCDEKFVCEYQIEGIIVNPKK